MTQENYTHISFLLDRSGSMQSIWRDVVGGYEAFITKQKAEPGKATFSLSTFAYDYTKDIDFAPLSDIPATLPSHIRPTGSTALLDSLHTLIVETGQHLANLPEDERPQNVVVVTYTDGEENASKEIKPDVLKALITLQETVYNWTFVFLASNINAEATAASLGIDPNRAATSTGQTYTQSNTLLSSKVSLLRSTGDRTVMAYTSAEKHALLQTPTAPVLSQTP